MYQGLAGWEDGKLVIDLTPKVEGKGTKQKIVREITADGEMIMVCIYSTFISLTSK